jgi:hypothetical protein
LPRTLKALYDQGDFAGIVRICRGVATTADIAQYCLLGACHEEDRGEAKRWLNANPEKQRKGLAETCSRIGNGFDPGIPKTD